MMAQDIKVPDIKILLQAALHQPFELIFKQHIFKISALLGDFRPKGTFLTSNALQIEKNYS